MGNYFCLSIRRFLYKNAKLTFNFKLYQFPSFESLISMAIWFICDTPRYLSLNFSLSLSLISSMIICPFNLYENCFSNMAWIANECREKESLGVWEMSDMNSEKNAALILIQQCSNNDGICYLFLHPTSSSFSAFLHYQQIGIFSPQTIFGIYVCGVFIILE